jgi:hypothetical protein
MCIRDSYSLQRQLEQLSYFSNFLIQTIRRESKKGFSTKNGCTGWRIFSQQFIQPIARRQF